MLIDSQYQHIGENGGEIPHSYGDFVHLLEDPYLFSLLARLSEPSTKQPLVNYLVSHLYQHLFHYVASREFPRCSETVTSRMAEFHEEGNFSASVIDSKTRAVFVNLARAGTLPSHACFDACNYLLEPDGIRQDHISINRKTDSDEQVVGTQLGGVKIGGSVNNAFVFFPDPMGATGSTIKAALDIFQNQVEGKPKRFLALHLIVTPEYLATLKSYASSLSIYALRLDRGLSSAEVLKSPLGKFWDQERGLNDKQYIVPGAGGVGEVINNAYV